MSETKQYAPYRPKKAVAVEETRVEIPTEAPATIETVSATDAASSGSGPDTNQQVVDSRIRESPVSAVGTAYLAPASEEPPNPEKTGITADKIIYWVRKHPVRNAKASLGDSATPGFLELHLEHGIVIRVVGKITTNTG